MKKLVSLSIALISIFLIGNLNAQIVIPQASPSGAVSSTVGLTEVEIDYFRPKMKGRQIFGEGTGYLVPFGKMWRTGANSGTVITFSENVTIDAKPVNAGKYLLLTIPGASQWEIIFYNDIKLGGNTGAFNSDNEVVRFNVKVQQLSRTIENLTFAISEISADSKTANIELTWEKTLIQIPFEVDFDTQVMESIQKSTSVNPNNYASAAVYYLDTNKDMKQAIKWIDLYLAENPNAFWHIHNKAKMQAKVGMKKEAKETAKLSIKIAKDSNDDFGYIKLNEDLISSLK